MVKVAISEIEVVAGSLFSLTCSVQPVTIDTPTHNVFRWTAPNSAHNVDTAGLVIPRVKTTDSGDYNCSAKVADSSGSKYVTDSEFVTDTVHIIVRKSLDELPMYTLSRETLHIIFLTFAIYCGIK